MTYINIRSSQFNVGYCLSQQPKSYNFSVDHYSAERWMLERHRDMIQNAERHARLNPGAEIPLRTWAASRLRSLADRLDGASMSRAHRPTA